MRKLGVAAIVLGLCGCEEPAFDLTVTLQAASFSANPALPDELATIDLMTIDIETVNGPADVRLSGVTAFALPRDDNAGLSVTGLLMNPQGAGDPVIRLEANAVITVRVTNGSLTNGEAMALCGVPTQLEVEFEGGGITAADTEDVTVLCS